MDRHPKYSAPRSVWPVAAVLALFFVLLEMLKAFRSSQWSGTSLWEGCGLAVGCGVYAGVLFALAALSGGVLRLATRRRLPWDAASGLGGLGGGVAVWAFLSGFREFSPTLDDAVVLGGLVAFTGVLLLTLALRQGSLAGFCALTGTALVGGIAALVAAGQYFLFEPERARAVTVFPLLWAAVVAMVGLAVWQFRGRWAVWGRFLYAAVVIAGPPAMALRLTMAPQSLIEKRPPSFVFVISDSLRADYLSTYGGPVAAPNVDRLAQRGVLFERSYSLAPWTMPSMAAMFSSGYPASLTPGVPGSVWLAQLWQYGVDPACRALAVGLREAGFVTGAFTANALLPGMPGMLDGFDVQATSHPILLLREGFFSHCPFLQDALAALFPSLIDLRPHDTTRAMTRYATAFLRRYRDRPFYLWIHYIDPHAPYDPPDRYRSMEGPWPFFHPYAGGERWGIPLLSPDFDLPPGQRPYVRSLYEGEVRYVDEHLGRVLGCIERLGLWENTYICFTSDHGEELWDHGKWGHGQSVYEELVRVPLLVAGPGLEPQRVEDAVSAVDLMPTFAELLGVQAEDGWRGLSLAPILRGETAPVERAVFAQGTSNKSWPYPQQAVVVRQEKLIRQLGADSVALYNLAEDPGEESDLAVQRPERAQMLDRLLLEWLGSFDSVFEAATAEGGGKANEDLLENLRGMGYL